MVNTPLETHARFRVSGMGRNGYTDTHERLAKTKHKSTQKQKSKKKKEQEKKEASTRTRISS